MSVPDSPNRFACGFAFVIFPAQRLATPDALFSR